MLFVFLPLVYAYAMAFMLRPTPARWALLAAAQIAALGSSSTALWAAPAASAIALCSAVRPSWRGARLLAVGLLASAYLAGAGWVAKGWMEEDAAARRAAYSQQEAQEGSQASRSLNRPGRQLEIAFSTVLGDARLRRAALASVLLAWAVSSGALARRFALAGPLAVALVLWQPGWSGWITDNVTGGSFWRTLWALPVPILISLTLIAPLAFVARPRRLPIGVAAWLLVLGAFAWLAPASAGPSRANHVALGWPALKVPELTYHAAAALSRSVPPGSVVVAPGDVSPWVATFHQRSFPVVVRDLYLVPFRAQIAEEEMLLRLYMTAVVGGEYAGPNVVPRFRAGLDRFAVKGVCLRRAKGAAPLRDVLRGAGFVRRGEAPGHEIWVRR
jgi:hypothetical protein